MFRTITEILLALHAVRTAPSPQQCLSTGLGPSSSLAPVVTRTPQCSPCLHDPFQSILHMGCQSDLSQAFKSEIVAPLPPTLQGCSVTHGIKHKLPACLHTTPFVIWPDSPGQPQVLLPTPLPQDEPMLQPYKYFEATHNSIAKQAFPDTRAISSA